MTRARGAVLGLAGLCVPALAATVLAQTLRAEDVPPRLSLDLSANLRQASNPDLVVTGGASDTTAALRFGLNYAAVTRDQDFRLGLTGALEAGALDGTGLTDPQVTLSYDRKGATSALGFDLTLTDDPVDLFEPQVQPDGSLSYGDLAAASGRIKTTNAALSLQTGTTGPLGFDLEARAFDRDYSQTNDPSVYDSANQSLRLTAHLRNVAGGEISLGLGAQTARQDDLVQTRRESRSLTLSYGRALDGATQLQASLGMTRAETTELGQTAAASTGLTGALGLKRDLGNGTAELGFEMTRDARGPRSALRFGRSLKLASGEFAAELGFGARQGEGGAATGRLSWTQDLASDRISVALSRQVVASETDADSLQSSLRADWSHDLAETRRLGLTYSLSAIEGTGEGGATIDGVTRQSLRASFAQDLGRDWALTTGVELRQSDRDSTGKAEDQAIFLTLARRFVLLP